VQLGGRLADAQETGGGLEGAERVEGRQLAAHGVIFMLVILSRQLRNDRLSPL
jgi:hypothetical protein